MTNRGTSCKFPNFQAKPANFDERGLSLIELKAIARELLPPSSMVRKQILAEPDVLSRESIMAKIEIFARMLGEELS